MKRTVNLLLVVAVSVMTPAVCCAAHHTIDMLARSFSPADISVAPGDTVAWINLAVVTHTSTSGTGCTPNGIWNSGNVAPGDSFVLVPGTAGVYPFYCIYHCDVGMIGTLTVAASGVSGARYPAAPPPAPRLYQNRPNPFRPSTRIDYEIDQAGNISVRIYNATGQMVRDLAEGRQPAGRHTIQWDGRDGHGADAAAGIYIYRVVIDGMPAGKKMLKLK